MCVLIVNGLRAPRCARTQGETAVTDPNHKPDMRDPQMSEARKAAEKKIGEAPFTPKEKSIDTPQSAAAPIKGHTTKP